MQLHISEQYEKHIFFGVKFDVKIVETLFYCMVQNVFRYLELCSCGSQV